MPNRKEKLRELAQDVADLTAAKGEAYGPAFLKLGDFFKLLYPEGIRPEQYVDAFLMARIFDKMMRIANNPAAFDENPYVDIMGYALLGTEKNEERESSRQPGM